MSGVYRNPTTKWVVAIIVALSTPLAVQAGTPRAAVLLALWVAALWLLALRPRLVLDERGATIRNIGTRFIAWPDVHDLGIEGRSGQWLTFHLSDGAVVRAWAVGWGSGAMLTSGLRLGRGYVQRVYLAAVNLWGSGRHRAT